jgi:hypothetical protein
MDFFVRNLLLESTPEWNRMAEPEGKQPENQLNNQGDTK